MKPEQRTRQKKTKQKKRNVQRKKKIPEKKKIYIYLNIFCAIWLNCNECGVVVDAVGCSRCRFKSTCCPSLTCWGLKLCQITTLGDVSWWWQKAIVSQSILSLDCDPLSRGDKLNFTYIQRLVSNHFFCKS